MLKMQMSPRKAISNPSPKERIYRPYSVVIGDYERAGVLMQLPKKVIIQRVPEIGPSQWTPQAYIIPDDEPMYVWSTRSPRYVETPQYSDAYKRELNMAIEYTSTVERSDGSINKTVPSTKAWTEPMYIKGIQFE